MTAGMSPVQSHLCIGTSLGGGKQLPPPRCMIVKFGFLRVLGLGMIQSNMVVLKIVVSDFRVFGTSRNGIGNGSLVPNIQMVHGIINPIS